MRVAQGLSVIALSLAGTVVAMAAAPSWGQIQFYNSGDDNNANAKVSVDKGVW